MRSNKSTLPIQSLDRGLQLLIAAGSSNRPLGLAELTEMLGIDRSSAYRLANTLKMRGFFHQSPDTKAYTLGPAIWQLASQMRQSNSLMQIAREHVAELASQTGETAHLAVRENDRVLFLEHSLTNQAVGVSAGSGRTEPLHCTALGKALISELSAQDINELLGSGELEKYTANTIRSAGDLASKCKSNQALGFAVDDEEFHLGVRCVAAPIHDFDGQIVAAIGMSAPTSRLSKRRTPELGRQVKEVAADISRQLGYVQTVEEEVV
ncbi:MAG: IclR family transcriptional regulator [Verrucomicrobiota bacterium]